MTPTIEATGLRKRFGKTVALDGLDLHAEPGQVLAVLGPNGAGKTTFVRMAATPAGAPPPPPRPAGAPPAPRAGPPRWTPPCPAERTWSWSPACSDKTGA